MKIKRSGDIILTVGKSNPLCIVVVLGKGNRILFQSTTGIEGKFVLFQGIDPRFYKQQSRTIWISAYNGYASEDTVKRSLSGLDQQIPSYHSKKVDNINEHTIPVSTTMSLRSSAQSRTISSSC